jgi:hypothetical protein
LNHYEYLLIDAQNLYWRAVMSSLKKFLDEENQKVYSNSIKNFLDRLNEFKSEYATKNSKIYLLFDNPLSVINKRKTIDVEYKHTREEKNVPKNFYKTLDVLQEILKNYADDLYIVRWDGLEADDLVYPVLTDINKNHTEVKKLIISADLDWARALGLDDNCEWYNFVQMYNKYNFKDFYGFSPVGKNIQMYKAIHGDNSDSIPNAVPYLPKEILLDIVDNYKNLEDLFSNLYKYPDSWKIKITEAKNRININYQLADYIVYEGLDNFIFKCHENIKMLRFWFDLHDLEFETRMYEKSVDLFFQKPKYPKVKR